MALKLAKKVPMPSQHRHTAINRSIPPAGGVGRLSRSTEIPTRLQAIDPIIRTSHLIMDTQANPLDWFKREHSKGL